MTVYVTNRTRLSALAALVFAAAAAALLLGAGRSSGGTTTQKVFRSAFCASRIDPIDRFTWGCTTITVNPLRVDAGATTTVTYAFKARRKLRYVDLCFTGMGLKGCAYKHKFTTIRQGAVIKRVFHLTAPAAASSGDQRLDNTARFYKRYLPWIQAGSPWEAGAYACVVAPSQPGWKCH